MRPALHRARRAVLACARQGRDALLGGRSPAASVAARALVAVFAFSLSAGHVGAQARPVSSPIELSGKRLIARGGRLYFGTDDRAFSYDPGASSLSGRGLTTRIAPVSTDWLTFLRTEGDAVLPIYGGTRDGQACFSGLRRYAPAGDELLFATKECLLAAELPAVLLGAHDFHVLSGRLFYKRDNKLYVSDGTAGGSRQIDDLGTVHSPLTRVDSRLVYTSNDIFSSFRDIASGSSYSLYLAGSDALTEGALVQLGGALYARGTTAAHGSELWRFDLSAKRNTLVSDLKPGTEGSRPDQLTVLGGALFVVADGPLGRELYRIDDNRMSLVRDIHPTGSAAPRELTVVGDRLYFRADDGVHGNELWETDGTEAGTRSVDDLYPGSRGSRPNALTELGGALYFWADDGVWGESLWRARAGVLELVETTSLTEPLALDGNLHDWPPRYDARTVRDPAGDGEPGEGVDLRGAMLAKKGGLRIGYEVTPPFARIDIARHRFLFDVDRRADTGWRLRALSGIALGADYMIEGISLYRHVGGTQQIWEWEFVADARWATSDVGVELEFDANIEATGIFGSRVLMWSPN